MEIEEIHLVRIMEHNMTDTSCYHVNNINHLVQEFCIISKYKLKEIRIPLKAKDSICIICQNDKEDLPRIRFEGSSPIYAAFDDKFKNQCTYMTMMIFQLIVKEIVEQKQEVMEMMLELSGSKMEKKQTFCYEKAIKKKMNTT